jgi:protein-tyrosine phosphatase
LIKVVFVCLGNICRSPTAEGIFRKLVDDAGLNDLIAVDSSGTSNWHVGGPPDDRSIATAKLRGIDMSNLKSRQAVNDDFNQFDYVVAMDHSNHKELLAMCPPGHESRLRMCLSFAPSINLSEVPDPYYKDGFDAVFDMLELAGRGLLAEIRDTYNL